MVPRPRIELGTRGFSVRQQHLCIEILTHLVAVGQVAEQLRQELGSNGNDHPKGGIVIPDNSNSISGILYGGRSGRKQ